MEVKDIVKMALNSEYEKVISEIKKLPPSAVNDFIDEIQDKGKDFVDDFFLLLTDDQRKEWRWLESAERERDYIMSIPYEDITDEDLENLKCCDI